MESKTNMDIQAKLQRNGQKFFLASVKNPRGTPPPKTQKASKQEHPRIYRIRRFINCWLLEL